MVSLPAGAGGALTVLLFAVVGAAFGLVKFVTARKPNEDLRPPQLVKTVLIWAVGGVATVAGGGALTQPAIAASAAGVAPLVNAAWDALAPPRFGGSKTHGNGAVLEYLLAATNDGDSGSDFEYGSGSSDSGSQDHGRTQASQTGTPASHDVSEMGASEYRTAVAAAADGAAGRPDDAGTSIPSNPEYIGTDDAAPPNTTGTLPAGDPPSETLPEGQPPTDAGSTEQTTGPSTTAARAAQTLAVADRPALRAAAGQFPNVNGNDSSDRIRKQLNRKNPEQVVEAFRKTGWFSRAGEQGGGQR
jgi:hypothetical protein